MDEKCMRQEHMLKLASCVLRKSAIQMAELRKDNEKLSSEIVNLKKNIEDANRFEETHKLAEMMHDKGLIKKADIDAKAHEMMSFDEDALKVVELSLSANEKVASDGVSNLSDFYVAETDSDDPMASYFKKTMESAIIEMANEL